LTKGQAAEGLAHASAGTRLLEDSTDDELRALAHWTRIYPLIVMGEMREATERLDELIESTRDHLTWGMDVWDLSAQLWARFMRAGVEAYAGHLGEARALFETALARIREHDERESEGWTLAWMADQAFLAGDAETAVANAQRGVESSVQLGSAYSRVTGSIRLGMALMYAGRSREAVGVLDETLETAHSEGTGFEMLGRAMAFQAEALLREGGATRAEELSREALATAQKVGSAADEVYAQRALAVILLERHGTEAADEVSAALDQAQALCERCAFTTLPGLLLQVRADLARVQGDDAARERHLRDALARYRSTGADLRAAQVEAELA
jgi:tetratricopeptide (TPR) repeat protein